MTAAGDDDGGPAVRATVAALGRVGSQEPYLDRDESPMAGFKESENASVRYVEVGPSEPWENILVAS